METFIKKFKGLENNSLSLVLLICSIFLLLSSYTVRSAETGVDDSGGQLAETIEIDELLNYDLEQLMNVQVITPTRSLTPMFRSPTPITVITYADIQRSTATTIPDLLRNIPGVNVRWNPMVQTLDIRGFGANPFTNRVLLMIDGIPYNSWNKGGFPQHPGFDFFNLENIQRIEVIRGSVSALYGENALNGVINIITLSGDELKSSTASIYVGEANHKTISLSSGDAIGDDGSYLASIKVTEQQLPADIWRDSDADARGYDLFLKGKYKGITASLFRRQDSFDGFSELIESPGLPPGPNLYESADKIEQTINIVSLGYEHTSADDRWSLEVNGSYSNRDGSHCAACHAPTQGEDFSESDEDHGSQFFTNIQLKWRGFKNHHVLLGGEYREIEAGDHEDELDTETPDQRFVTSYDKSSFFVQDSWELPGNKWQLISGLRYDSSTSPTLFDSNVFPRLDLVGELSDDLVLKVNWNQSARYPSFSELYQSSNFFSLQNPNIPGPIVLADFVPNSDLQPETIENFGVGINYRLSTQWELTFDFFQYVLEDPIVIAYGANPPPVVSTIRFENHPDDALVRGFELGIRGNSSASLSLFANWSYQINSQQGNNTDSAGNLIEFSYSPRHKINFGGTYTPTDELDFTLEVNWRDEYTAPAFWYPFALGQTELTPLDDYTYVNLKLVYQPRLKSLRKNEKISFSIVGRNLTDERVFENTDRKWW